MEAIQDPAAVINTLQARIHQLEGQLRLEREQAQESIQGHYSDVLRHLRPKRYIEFIAELRTGQRCRRPNDTAAHVARRAI